MPHIVMYRGADGNPGYHETEEVHDAVAFVERLRNTQGVEVDRILRTEEVNFEYRPYFRVELTAGEPALTAAAVAPAVSAGDPVSVPKDPPASTSSATSAASSSSSTDSTTADSSTVRSITDAPTISTDGGDNGVGARRGLFGR